METNHSTRVNQLDWLLDDLVMRVPHLPGRCSSPGRPGARHVARTWTRRTCEHLAALAAGVPVACQRREAHFGGESRQSIIEMTQASSSSTAAGQGTCLAVLTDSGRRRGPGGVRDGDARPARRRPPAGQHADPRPRMMADDARTGAPMPSDDETWLDARGGPGGPAVRHDPGPYASTPASIRPGRRRSGPHARVDDPGRARPGALSVSATLHDVPSRSSKSRPTWIFRSAWSGSCSATCARRAS